MERPPPALARRQAPPFCQSHDRLQPRRFGLGHAPPEGRQPVVTALGFLPLPTRAFVVGDQTARSETRQDAIERAKLETDGAVARVFGYLSEAVRMARTFGQGEQDLKIVRRQRLEVAW